MGAPANNQFWKLRTRHGHPPIFTPPELEKACDEYFQHTSKRVWIEEDWVGKDAERVERKTCAPFTKTGLYLFLGIDEKTWRNYKEKEGYVRICSRVEDIIYTQKFEGAAVGAFNHNIIARDLGLRDKQEIEQSVAMKMESTNFEIVTRKK